VTSRPQFFKVLLRLTTYDSRLTARRALHRLPRRHNTPPRSDGSEFMPFPPSPLLRFPLYIHNSEISIPSFYAFSAQRSFPARSALLFSLPPLHSYFLLQHSYFPCLPPPLHSSFRNHTSYFTRLPTHCPKGIPLFPEFYRGPVTLCFIQ